MTDMLLMKDIDTVSSKDEAEQLLRDITALLKRKHPSSIGYALSGAMANFLFALDKSGAAVDLGGGETALQLYIDGVTKLYRFMRDRKQPYARQN